MMSALRLSELQHLLGGELSADAAASQLTINSKLVAAGDLFLALKGENFNGNQFVGQAAEKKAAAAIVSEKQAVDIPQLIVSDTRLALGKIAGLQRDQFKAPVIALTGSAGKTSTKEMLAGILSECGTVLATKGNLNNEVGVPLTLLELLPSHQYAVVEMGAAKKTDISYLCQWVKPNIAIVTNALQAHLEGFGSRDAIAETKGEIYQQLSSCDVAIINIDSEYADLWRQQAKNAIVKTFSLSNSQADVYATKISEQKNYTEFSICNNGRQVRVKLALLGRHNVANALAASAAALAAAVSLHDIKAGLEKVTAVSGRLKLIRLNKELTLIDDSYNANPDSVKVAIDVLAQTDKQSCLVLGDMAELGEHAQALHADIGSYCKEQNISHLVVIGRWAEDVAAAFGEGALAFEDFKQFKDAGLPYCQYGRVLVKGSRSAQMERVVEEIKIISSIKEKY